MSEPLVIPITWPNGEQDQAEVLDVDGDMVRLRVHCACYDLAFSKPLTSPMLRAVSDASLRALIALSTAGRYILETTVAPTRGAFLTGFKSVRELLDCDATNWPQEDIDAVERLEPSGKHTVTVGNMTWTVTRMH